MISGERLKQRMIEAGLSQSELARRVGISQTAINKLVLGGSGGSRHLHTIARELGTTPAYLTGETDDPSEGAVPAPTQRDIAEHFDLVEIHEIDLAYGMGGTFTDVPVEVEVHHFPRKWVESITNTPASALTLAHGRGDSMAPTIHDRDMIIIDRSERSVREQDAIWALTIGEIGMIRRVRIRGEKVTLLADNDRVPNDEAHPDEVNVVGRVVFIGRRT
jgi:phage repressor protein C with HTH and peptisase S24 domain